MSTTPVKACLRCHSKKIKCSGYPQCLSCAQAKTRCEAYIRPRRHESSQLKDAHTRIQWLQDEIRRGCSIDCTSLPTGTPLNIQHSQDTPHNTRLENITTSPSGSVLTTAQTPSENLVVNDAPDASLLALNASGELRYLGASSGAFFASCAAAIVRSSASAHQSPRAEAVGGAAAPSRFSPIAPTSLSRDEIALLTKSYEMWVHPLYPLFDLVALRDLVNRHVDRLLSDRSHTSPLTVDQNVELTIVYVVMALGATNRSNTIKQLRQDCHLLVDGQESVSGPSPASLCTIAVKHLEVSLRSLHTNVEYIKMLLLFCIYSSYGPVGPSQWQLAGLAIRMAIEIGLHNDPQRWYATERELDQRRRVFWTAYAIEVTLAYNLGRPPSISSEHITTKLPELDEDVRLGILHIEHRQIQGKIMSRMYSVSKENLPWQERQALIGGLQADLDQWRATIPSANQDGTPSPYPPAYWHRLYYSTTFVLHRYGPLCPLPSPESLHLCIRSAGAYIDAISQVLRSSNVPQSWMLIQGVLSAALTMLISARANFKKLDWSLLLVDLPAWNRKCSVCLAIMNERWKEDLLSKLETHVEILADETLKFITSGLAAERAGSSGQENDISDASENRYSVSVDRLFAHTTQTNTYGEGSGNIPNLTENDQTIGWEPLGVFSEFLGTDFIDPYWDMQGIDSGFASTFQT